MKRRKDYVQRAVLASIGFAGMLAVAAVAPNTIQLLGRSAVTRRFIYQSKSVLGRLADQGHVRFEQRNGVRYAVITERGRQKVALLTKQNALRSEKPKRWDKRWRLVMFDVPEHRKSDRDRLRRTMIEAGFVCFQDSVWIFPHDCEDFVALLKADRQFGNTVRYAIVELLENDRQFRKHFKLKD